MRRSGGSGREGREGRDFQKLNELIDELLPQTDYVTHTHTASCSTRDMYKGQLNYIKFVPRVLPSPSPS